MPGDPSSAAFPALAAMASGGSIRLPDVLGQSTCDVFMRTLETMGSLGRTGAPTGIGESTVTYTVMPNALRESGSPGGHPAMIDELLLLACVAARAEGEP